MAVKEAADFVIAGDNPAGWNQLVQLLVQVQDEQHMDELLRLLLTFNERESLANRYRIVQALLCSHKPQRQIAKELRVSIAKVTAGSNGLKHISGSLKQLLQQQMAAAVAKL